MSYIILKDRQLAEDNAQDVFITIMKNAPKYQKGKNVKTWVMAIARNQAISFLRREKHTVYTDFTDEYEVNTLLIDHSGIEDITCNRISIGDAVNMLDNASREIIFLRIYTGLKFSQISEVLSIPLGTVTWKYREALKKLKSML